MQRYTVICDNVEQYTTIYNDIQQYTTIYNDIQQYTTIYNRIQGYTRIYNDIQQYTQVYNNMQRYTRIYKDICFSLQCCRGGHAGLGGPWRSKPLTSRGPRVHCGVLRSNIYIYIYIEI